MESKQQEREEQQRGVPALVAASDSGSGCEEHDTHTAVVLINDLENALISKMKAGEPFRKSLRLFAMSSGSKQTNWKTK